MLKASWLAVVVMVLLAQNARADFLIITDTYKSHAEAQTRAAAVGGWALETDAYAGLKQGLFAVVRGPYSSRADAEGRLGFMKTGGRYKGAYVKDAGALKNPTSALKGLPPKVIAALLGEVSIAVADKPAAKNGCEPGEPYQEVTLSYVTLERTLNDTTGEVDGKPKRASLDVGGFWIMKSTGEIERMRICAE